MRAKFRLIALLVALLVLAPNQQASAEQDGAVQKVHASNKAQGMEVAHRRVADIPSAPIVNPKNSMDAAKYKPPCNEPNDSAKCQMQAEWEGVQASKDAASWAKWQTLLSLLTVIGLVVTLCYSHITTRMALGASKDAEASLNVANKNAESLARQVDVSKSAAERHLRAYVGVSEIDIRPAGDGHFAARIKVKNFGLTPAYNCEVFTAARLDTFPIVSPHGTDPQPRHQTCNVTLYPGAELPAFAVCDASGAMERLRSGELGIYVYGYVTYSDAEGTDRQSNFAYRGTESTLLDKSEMHVCMDGNTAT